MILGKCPYCKGEVNASKLTIQGKKITLYSCEHAKKERDIHNDYVFTAESTCRFRVYSNALMRWNKRFLSESEMKQLLQDGQLIVRLYGRKEEYFKCIIPDLEYGISVLWDFEVA